MSDSARILTASELAASGRNPPVPCTLRLNDGGLLELLRPLRVLPGKRISGESVWNGQRVMAKIFIAPGSARHWRREHDGIAALAAANIPGPPMLAAGTLEGGGHYLLTVFLPDAHSLADIMKTSDADTVRPLLETACARIGQLHANGLIHEDPHPGNFLLDAGELSMIDGAAVHRRALPLPVDEADDDLARFLAQLPPDTSLETLLAAYRASLPRTVEAATLAPRIEAHRQLRLMDYLRKTTRPCTLFDVRQSFRYLSAVARDEAASLTPLLADPDGIMQTGEPIKRGNTTAVTRVHVGGRDLIVKRYNIKNTLHALSRAWRPSRAWHSWRESHRLCFLGIDTPKPRALIEERFGPLRRRAWLVTDYCAGAELSAFFAPYIDAAAPPPAEGAALLRFIEALHARRISHGDFKASNLLWDEARGCIIVVDLDSMTQHTHPATHARAWRRDRARLLANWPKESGLHRWLDEHLPQGNGFDHGPKR